MANANNHKLHMQLWNAVNGDKIAQVKTIMSQHEQEIDINFGPAGNFSTLLMRAAYRGSAEKVELLIKHGANITVKDSVGNTVLHWAVRNKQYDTIKQLVGNISNLTNSVSDIINEKNDAGESVASLCFSDPHLKVDFLDFLKFNGAIFNDQTPQGISLLHIAAARLQSKETMQWLIDHLKETDKNVTDIQVSNKNAMFQFVSTSEYKEIPIYGFTPFIFAMLSCNLEMARVLVQNNADVLQGSLSEGFISQWEEITKDESIRQYLNDVQNEAILNILAELMESSSEIHGFYEEDNTIYVDIKKGQRDLVSLGLLETCPEVFKLIKSGKIMLVDQSCDPEYVVKPWTSVAPTTDELVSSVEACKSFNETKLDYGSIAGFVNGSNDTMYAITANHVVAKDNELKGTGKHFFMESDVELLKISNSFFGVFGNYGIDSYGVDAAIMPLLIKPPASKCQQIPIYSASRNDLLHKNVTMRGATTPSNTGQIWHANYYTLIGKKCTKSLMVKPTGRVTHFVEKGDSGALVKLATEDLALGLVSKKQTDYMHQGIVLHQSAVIVLLSDCLGAIKEKHADISFDRNYMIEIK